MFGIFLPLSGQLPHSRAGIPELLDAPLGVPNPGNVPSSAAGSGMVPRWLRDLSGVAPSHREAELEPGEEQEVTAEGPWGMLDGSAGNRPGSSGKRLGKGWEFGKRAGSARDLGTRAGSGHGSAGKELDLPGILGKGLEELGMLQSWAVLGMFPIPEFQLQPGAVADGIPRPGMNPGRE